MKKIWPLLQYYYCTQPVIKYAAFIGVILFLVKIPAFFINDKVTFVLGMLSFSFLFLLPFVSGVTTLRALISNSHTALIPGFHLRAGIALLIIGSAMSVYLYLNWLVFSGDQVSPLIILRTFTGMSLYVFCMQLILSSRFFITIISIAPIVIVMISLRYKEILDTVFMDPGYTLALFIVSLAGWLIGLRHLDSQDKFKPLCPAATSWEAWSTFDGGLITEKAIGTTRSAAGTLLLGYPDSWSSMFIRVSYYYFITPFLTTAALFMVGFGEKWDRPMMDSLVSIFLLISLFCAIYYIFVYGELAARARLVWLRFGTDRLQQWQLVEKYCLQFLLIYYLCALLVTGLALTFTDTQPVYLWHYLLIIMSNCLFNLYLALMAKANCFPTTILYIALTLIAGILFKSITMALSDTNPTFVPLICLEILFTLLGFVFRTIAKKGFLDIDWRLVTVNKSPGYALSHD